MADNTIKKGAQGFASMKKEDVAKIAAQGGHASHGAAKKTATATSRSTTTRKTTKS